MRRVLFVTLGLALVGSAISGFTRAETVTCPVAVAINGDTLKWANNSRIRIASIDAPELGQTCRGPSD